jgi:hypothetical protein
LLDWRKEFVGAGPCACPIGKGEHKALPVKGVARDELFIELDKNKIDFIAYDPSELEKELDR